MALFNVIAKEFNNLFSGIETKILRAMATEIIIQL